MNNMDLLDPHGLYFSRLKEEHNNNVIKTFDELVKTSKVDESKNEIIVNEIKEEHKNLKVANKKLSRIKFLNTFLIILTVLTFITSLISFIIVFTTDDSITIPLIVAIVSLLVNVGLAILIIKIIKPKVKAAKNNKQIIETKIKDLTTEAYALLSPLNSLFDYNLASSIVSKTVPLIEMDKYFDLEKYEYLNKKYGYNESEDINQSCIYVQSGSILGNPFLLQKIKFQRMIKHTYTGHLTVSWTETQTINGKRQTVRRTQTLYANVTADKPDYYHETWLTYGNDAASNLSFTRFPSSASGKNEKEIEKIVAKGEKKLDDLVEETLMDDKEGEYVKLGNVEFDVLFGAQNRDNELEFRLLFTPLAQSSLLKLIKEKEPYGDDFFVEKKKNLNYVYASHNDSFAYDIDPTYFEDYDLKEMRKRFIEYNNTYFKSFFFTLAPLLSIPLYQQQKPVEYIYQRGYSSNFTTLEHEVLANKFTYEAIKPNDATTELIVKTKLDRRSDDSDIITLTAYSFKGEPRVTPVPVTAMNGRIYMVPVHWIEYLPTSKTSQMEVFSHELRRVDYLNKIRDNNYISLVKKYTNDKNIVYKNGLMSLLTDKKIDIEDLNKFKV